MFRRKQIPPFTPEETAQRDHAQRQIEEIADILKTRKYMPPERSGSLLARTFLNSLSNGMKSETKAIKLQKSMEEIAEKEPGFTGVVHALDHAQNVLVMPEFSMVHNRDMQLMVGDFIRVHTYHLDCRRFPDRSTAEVIARIGPLI